MGKSTYQGGGSQMPSSARRVVDVPQKCRDAPEDSSIESLAAKVTKTHGEGEQVWVK